MAVLVRHLLIALVALAYVSASGFDAPTKTTKDRRHAHREVAEKVYNTNAKRFAAGLPPLKPRHLSNPTKVRRSRQSASPSPTLVASLSRRSLDTSTIRAGLIQLISVTNSTAPSYLSRSFTADGTYLTTSNKDEALRVEFDIRSAGSAGGRRLSNLEVIWPQDEDCSFLGLVAAPTNLDPVDYLGEGTRNRVCLGMAPEVHQTRRLSLPMSDQATHARTYLEARESTVWRMTSGPTEPGTWPLSPVWINPDGRRPEGMELKVLSGGALCLGMTRGEKRGQGHEENLVALRLVLDN